MKTLRAYHLAFAGLADGQHEFDYELNSNLLKALNFDLFEDLKVEAKVTLDKAPSLLQLEVKLKGQVLTACDRCAENFWLEVEGQDFLVIKLLTQLTDDLNQEDEVVYLEHTASSYNLGYFLYEALVLSLPTRRVHPDDENGEPTCNPEILARLAAHQPSNESNEDDDQDDVWAVLKNIQS